MGGYVGERIGTKKGFDEGKLALQSQSAAEAGTHLGRQTGKLEEGVHHSMGQVSDTFTRSDFNLTKYGQKDSSGDGTATSVGEYSSQKTGAQKASGTKGGDLSEKKKGKKKGLSQLQVRKN